VSTGPTQPQVHPAIPGREALLASVAARLIGAHEVQVTATGCHEFIECRCEVQVERGPDEGQQRLQRGADELALHECFHAASKRDCHVAWLAKTAKPTRPFGRSYVSTEDRAAVEEDRLRPLTSLCGDMNPSETGRAPRRSDFRKRLPSKTVLNLLKMSSTIGAHEPGL
jgi:hypothetical protein